MNKAHFVGRVYEGQARRGNFGNAFPLVDVLEVANCEGIPVQGTFVKSFPDLVELEMVICEELL